MLRISLGAGLVLLACAVGADAQEAPSVVPGPAPAAPASAVPPVAMPLPEPELVAMNAVLYVRTTDTVNVRATPSTTGEIVGRFVRGEPVTVTGRITTASLWYQVVAKDGGPGFVLGLYLGPRVHAGAPAIAAPPTLGVIPAVPAAAPALVPAAPTAPAPVPGSAAP